MKASRDLYQARVASPQFHNALTHLCLLLEHACDHSETAAKVLVVEADHTFPRDMVALAVLEIVRHLVADPPALGRVEREMVAASALMLADELMLPDLPGSLR